jgi:hypothetical protein
MVPLPELFGRQLDHLQHSPFSPLAANKKQPITFRGTGCFHLETGKNCLTATTVIV